MRVFKIVGRAKTGLTGGCSAVLFDAGRFTRINLSFAQQRRSHLIGCTLRGWLHRGSKAALAQLRCLGRRLYTW